MNGATQAAGDGGKVPAAVVPSVSIVGGRAPIAGARNGGAATQAARMTEGGRYDLTLAAWECLQAAGIDVPVSQLRDDPFRVVMQGMETTSDFPAVVTEYVHRLAVRQLQLLPPWIRRVGRLINVTDFRDHVSPILGETELRKLNESGEIEFAKLPEKGETFRISTYASRSAISRQLWVNDSDGAIIKAVSSPMAAVNNLEANVATELLAANAGLGPTMSDDATLFHASHGNVGVAVLDVDGLDAGRQAMRAQTTLDGKNPINAPPRYLMVPAALETGAEKVLAELQPAKAADVNPFSQKLEMVVEPRLDAISATAWYLFADPAFVPTFGYAYLRGKTGPMVEIKPAWEQDGLGIRTVHDYGAVAEDWRGMFRSTGAGA